MSYFPPYIDAFGIHMPTYEARLQDFLSAYRSIFGQEAQLDPAVPDYQLLSVFAKALDDTSALVLQAYNSRNPAYASGQALDLLLPQYGIAREPGETDAEVRRRMNLATASSSVFSLDAMEAELRRISGVSQLLIRVNDEDTTVDSIPGHTIAAYVNGGNAGLVASAIWRKKPPGIGTYGTVSRSVTDEQGNSHTVKFSRPTLLSISFRIELRSYSGFDEAAVTAAAKSLSYPASSMASISILPMPDTSETADPDMPAMIMDVSTLTWARPPVRCRTSVPAKRKILMPTPEPVSMNDAIMKNGIASVVKESSPLTDFWTMAIMDADGYIATVGNFINENGLLFSNDSFIMPRIHWTFPTQRS